MNGLKIVYGPSFSEVAERVCQKLDTDGHRVEVFRNPEGTPTSVGLPVTLMGANAFIIQTACGHMNDEFMITLMIADMLRSQRAKRITLVAPYFFYPDRDSGHDGRQCVTLRLAATLLQAAGVSQVMSFDFHNRDAAELMAMPIINLRAAPLLAHHIRRLWAAEAWPLTEVIGVASSFGEATDIIRMTRLLGINTRVVIDRPKQGPAELLAGPNVSVEGKHCLIIDDAVRTGGTVAEAAQLLTMHGAASVRVAATHLGFPKQAAEAIAGAPIDKIVVTQTVPMSSEAVEALDDRLEVISTAGYLAEAIRCVREGMRISRLWEDPRTLYLS